MKKSVILSSFIAIAATFLLVFTGCFSAVTSENAGKSVQTSAESGNADTDNKISVGTLRGPSSIGMVSLIESNKDVKDSMFSYEIIASPDIMATRILSGETDIAVLPTNVAAKLYNKGAEIRMAAIVGGGVLYLVSNKKLEINRSDWDALKGHKVQLIAKGSTPDIAFRYLAESNGLDIAKDITTDYSFDQIELTQLMIAGNADLGILPEPFVTNSLKSNKDLEIIMDIQEEWGKVSKQDILPQTCLVISKKLIDNNSSAIDEFIREYSKSIDWANNNPKDAGKLAEGFEIGIKEVIAEEVIPRCNLMFESGDNSKSITKDYLEILNQFSPDDIGGKIPDEEFYYVK